MYIDPDSGLIEEARQHSSPNCDARPDESDISLIVIHGISLPPGEFGDNYIDQLFTNNLNSNEHPYFKEIEGLKVSSHFLVKRDGELVQYVPVHKRAWHAGVSSYKNRENCNDFSIGIELEGTDEIPYTNIQYEVLAETIKSLTQSYPNLTAEALAGHSDIAPGRKTDPGIAFDWQRLHLLLAE
ncbi:MAG: 1,6-anhydro-N-acetylmuramyl-L-alanine amidase AmpD [Gammaproteobacteria bacterium]|nr:1,6-anhydro-N-acetylmuramyl-L-alanine amidase AmpD [Gammaproteobacteria bacterium]MCW8988547.1 1,6-anhydro-N-acetylmuramyl-L-alanine amidase AmpD [Gammaproteobacteria bacterium]MCW9031483.1 1,6-anhydro-N-acetylmuramyl-L-alanine amidase AmpD [Gammaproteobacteria bacterium]